MSETVLVPHDLTALSDTALEVAHGLCAEPGQLHVLHVLPRIEPLTPVLVWPRDEDEPRKARALRALQTHLQGAPYAGATLHVQTGDPASRIVELARALAAHRIVMPTHSRKGLERMVLGSVAEHVVRFAPCPVLVLPAAVLAARVPVHCGPPCEDRTPEEQVDALACELLSRVEQTPGRLTAARVAIPSGPSADWWESALERRLAASGLEFVDLVFTAAPSQRACVLDLRFDETGFA